uniref:DUF3577 domain-containing protein n=1 Tax=Steinernema glaseri TaxID=37863 RepID=A0A1I8AL75_9BILA
MASPSSALALFDHPTIFRSELTADVADYRQCSINGKFVDSLVLSTPPNVDRYEVPKEEMKEVDRVRLASFDRPRGLEYVAEQNQKNARNWVVLVVEKQKTAPEGTAFRQTYSVQHSVVFKQ